MPPPPGIDGPPPGAYSTAGFDAEMPGAPRERLPPSRFHEKAPSVDLKSPAKVTGSPMPAAPSPGSSPPLSGRPRRSPALRAHAPRRMAARSETSNRASRPYERMTARAPRNPTTAGGDPNESHTTPPRPGGRGH